MTTASVPPCPTIEKALLDYLKAVFPATVPEHEASQWNLGALSGNRQVIMNLEARFAQQQKATSPHVFKQT
jgi:hypothetical protein